MFNECSLNNKHAAQRASQSEKDSSCCRNINNKLIKFKELRFCSIEKKQMMLSILTKFQQYLLAIIT